MPSQPPAKFFVNQGVVSSREDMLNLLRPLLKQTVSYRYVRGRDVVSQWRKRFFEQRLAGLENRPRRDRPPTFPPTGAR